MKPKWNRFWVMFWFIFWACIYVNAYPQDMDLTKAVIHHTASSDKPAWKINDEHQERKTKSGINWKMIGYHWIIRKDGRIEEGRPMTKIGAHARYGKEYSRNHYIGIALTGFDSFTEEQELALTQLLLDLGITHIEPHHEECPGPGLDLEKISARIK